MPQAQTIVLNDGSKDISFNPNNKTSDGTFHLLDTGVGQADLMSHLALSAVAKASGVSRGQLKLEVPKVVVDSDTTISYPSGKAILEVSCKFPSNFSATDRAAAFAQLSDALGNTSVISTLRDTESMY